MLLRNCAVIGNGMIAKRTLAKILEARVDAVTGRGRRLRSQFLVIKIQSVP